jgi:hypothetical protein
MIYSLLTVIYSARARSIARSFKPYIPGNCDVFMQWDPPFYIAGRQLQFTNITPTIMAIIEMKIDPSGPMKDSGK